MSQIERVDERPSAAKRMKKDVDVDLTKEVIDLTDDSDEEDVEEAIDLTDDSDEEVDVEEDEKDEAYAELLDWFSAQGPESFWERFAEEYLPVIYEEYIEEVSEHQEFDDVEAFFDTHRNAFTKVLKKCMTATLSAKGIEDKRTFRKPKKERKPVPIETFMRVNVERALVDAICDTLGDSGAPSDEDIDFFKEELPTLTKVDVIKAWTNCFQKSN